MTKKEERNSQRAAYEEMVKYKPREAAVAAFRHKPYTLDWKKEEWKNGEERQGF